MTRLATLTVVLLVTATQLGAQPSEAPVTAINPPSLPDSTQFGYSQAVVVDPGLRLVFVAGQVGLGEGEPGNFEAQVDRAFDNLRRGLEAAEASMEDVVKITLLVVDHDETKLAYLGEARRAAFGDGPPASLLVPVTRLYAPGVLFEIDAVAVAP